MNPKKLFTPKNIIIALLALLVIGVVVYFSLNSGTLFKGALVQNDLVIRAAADSTPPVIISETLSNTKPIEGNRITITVQVTDAETGVVSVTANGTSLAQGRDLSYWSGTMTALSVGTHSITVVATNGANPALTKTTTALTYTSVPLDTTPPFIGTPSISPTSPKQGDTVTFTVPVTDNESGVTSVTANGVNMTQGTGNIWTITYPSQTSGSYSLTIQAINGVNLTTRSNAFNYSVAAPPTDTTPPFFGTPTISPTSPKNADTVTLSVQVTDAESGVTSVTANGANLTLGSGNIWSKTYPSQTAGNYSISLQATNGANLSRTATTLNYTVAAAPVDSTPPFIGTPSISPTSPKAGDSVTISLSVTDAESGVSSVTANGVALTMGSGNVWTITYPSQSAGSYSLTFQATNDVNLKSTSNALTYSVAAPDSTPPVITNITKDPALPNVGDVVTLTVTAKDLESGVNSVTANGVNMTHVLGGDNWTGSLTATASNHVSIAATNGVNLSTSAPDYYFTAVSAPTDTTPPTISNITRNPAAPNVGDVVTLTVTASDLDSGVTSVTANGVNMSHGSGNDWTSSMTVAASNHVNIVATNGVNLTYSAPDYYFTGASPTDTTPPTVTNITRSISTPNTGDVLTLTVTARDLESGVTSVTANGVDMTHGSGDDWTLSYTVAAGSNRIMFVVTNGANLTYSPAQYYFTGA